MLSFSTPEYVVRNTVSAISSAIEKIALLNSSKAIGSRRSAIAAVLPVAAVLCPGPGLSGFGQEPLEDLAAAQEHRIVAPHQRVDGLSQIIDAVRYPAQVRVQRDRQDPRPTLLADLALERAHRLADAQLHFRRRVLLDRVDD